MGTGKGIGVRERLRQEYLQRRRGLNPCKWKHLSELMCFHLSQWCCFKEAEVVLTFANLGQEPDLAFLWQAFPEKSWGFPRCVANGLQFHQVDISQVNQDLVAGTWGTREPHPRLPRLFPDGDAVVLVPALVCDVQGFRLGYGKGFYDRFLADSPSMIKVGVIFSDGVVETLPRETWDIPMDFLATETGVRKSIP